MLFSIGELARINERLTAENERFKGEYYKRVDDAMEQIVRIVFPLPKLELMQRALENCIALMKLPASGLGTYDSIWQAAIQLGEEALKP